MAITRHWHFSPNGKNIVQLNSKVNFHGHQLDRLFKDTLASILLPKPVLLACAGPEHICGGNGAINNIQIATDAPGPLYGQTYTLAYLLGDKPFRLGNPSVALSYGDIVALAGDYYARFDDSDSGYTGYRWTREENSFVGQPMKSATDIAQALVLARRPRAEEMLASVQTKNNLEILIKRRFTWTWVHPGTPEDEDEDRALRQITSLSDAELRMGLLALENWDHFHPHCINRYNQLQGQSILKAVTAGNQWRRKYENLAKVIDPDFQNEATREFTSLIHDALAINAFANHFLTDAFSSGHFYPHRKEDFEKRGNIVEVKGPWYWSDPSISPTRGLITQHGTTVQVGEVLVAGLALFEHDFLGRESWAVCHAHRDDSGKLIPFKVVGDWRLDQEMLLGEPHICKMWTQERFLRCAVTSSIGEVLRAFFGGMELFGKDDELAALRPPLEYVPHCAVELLTSRPNSRLNTVNCDSLCGKRVHRHPTIWKGFPKEIQTEE